MVLTMSQTPSAPKSVAARFAAVQARVGAAASQSGRDPSAVHLVAVTKTHDAEVVAPVLELGHRLFGENRVQEAERKWPALKARWPDAKLHLIGPLQTNKVRAAVALFDAIQTVDRPKLAEAIAAEQQRQGRQLQLFVQVNTGEETQKAGVAPGESKAFVRQCREEFGLVIAGLMCIPPVDAEPDAHFSLLKQLAADAGVRELSMGMSGDYEAAVRAGAT